MLEKTGIKKHRIYEINNWYVWKYFCGAQRKNPYQDHSLSFELGDETETYRFTGIVPKEREEI